MAAALASRDNASLASWTSALRPTITINALGAQAYPLRIIDCLATCNSQTVVFKQPQDWKFVIISHRWQSNPPWQAYERPWPAIGGMMVTAVTKDSVLALARWIPVIANVAYFWVDCLCIDQDSRLEMGREILNMGSYYSCAQECLIFPEGIDHVGPPMKADGSRSSWYARAWTLQEEILSRSKARYLFSTPNNASMTASTFWSGWKTSLGWGGASSVQLRTSSLRRREELSSELKWELCAVPSVELSQALGDCMGTIAVESSRELALSVLNEDLARRQWTIVDVLREMYRREATREEDLIYGCLGLLGIRPASTPYGVGLREALRVLVDALHVDQRLMLCAVEAFHGHPDSIDGYSALPAWREPNALCAPRFRIKRTLGTCQFGGFHGMDIFVPCSKGRIAMHGSIRQIIDNIGSQLHMMQVTYHQSRDDDNDVSTSSILALHNFDDPPHRTLTSRSVIMLAIAECDFYTTTPRAVLNALGTEILFLCMICTQHGSVLRKNGIAVVKAVSHTWTTARYCVA